MRLILLPFFTSFITADKGGASSLTNAVIKVNFFSLGKGKYVKLGSLPSFSWLVSCSGLFLVHLLNTKFLLVASTGIACCCPLGHGYKHFVLSFFFHGDSLFGGNQACPFGSSFVKLLNSRSFSLALDSLKFILHSDGISGLFCYYHRFDVLHILIN